MERIPVFEVFVPILPVPKSHRRYGSRIVLTDRCRDYQKEVIAFLEKYKEDTLDGYLWADYTFYLKRPQSAKNMQYPARKPDHDNLCKALQDCLEKAEIIKNDSRIVVCQTRKVFCAGRDSGGIIQPGTKVQLGILE